MWTNGTLDLPVWTHSSRIQSTHVLFPNGDTLFSLLPFRILTVVSKSPHRIPVDWRLRGSFRAVFFVFRCLFNPTAFVDLRMRLVSPWMWGSIETMNSYKNEKCVKSKDTTAYTHVWNRTLCAQSTCWFHRAMKNDLALAWNLLYNKRF